MNIKGKYETNNGIMIIENDGDQIIGKYAENGMLKGTLSNNVFEGEWGNNGQQGLFQFEFGENGAFNGKYKKGLEAGPMRGKWTGKLISSNETAEETVLEKKEIEPKDELREEYTVKNEAPRPKEPKSEKEKKINPDPGYLSQLYQKEDYAFLCECVDTSQKYSPNIIEKIIVASWKCDNKEILDYCNSQCKQYGQDPLKMKEYEKWKRVRQLLKEGANALNDEEFEEKKKTVSTKSHQQENKDPDQKTGFPNSILDPSFKIRLLESIDKKDEACYKKYREIWDSDESWYADDNAFKIYEELLHIFTEHDDAIMGKVKAERFLVDQKYDSGDRYAGELIGTNRDGKGTYYFSNGDYFEGTWKNDEFISGKGRRTNKNGYVYEGELGEGFIRNGIGKLFDPDGKIIKEGLFINNEFEGDLKNNLNDVKENVKKFAKSFGYSSMLGKLFKRDSGKNSEEFKAFVEEAFTKGVYNEVIKECVKFIEKEEDLLSTEPAMYYLLLAGEKLHADQNSFWSLASDVYHKHKSKRVNSFFVKSFLREAFKQLDEYIVLKTDKGAEYYTDELLYEGYTFPLGKEYKPLLDSYADLFEKAREKVSYEDKQLEAKINLCETRVNNTLVKMASWEEFAARNRAENAKKKTSSYTSSSSSKKPEQKKSTVQGGKFEITYEVKLKQDASFGNSFMAKMEATKQGKGFLDAMSTSNGKGGFRERSITVNHDKNTLSNGDAKNYVAKNDRDVQKGVAGSSTVKIVKIKKL